MHGDRSISVVIFIYQFSGFSTQGQYSGTFHNGPSHEWQPLYNRHWLWHQLKLLQN